VSLPAFSVRRPVFTSMVVLIVIVLGIFSFRHLQIDLLPPVELPTVSVRTTYSGASPEVMERLVTSILEEIVATVPGVEEMTSSSSEGWSQIRITFAWGTNIDAAAIAVQAKIEDEINELPDDIDRPRVSKFDIDSFPVVLLGISSELDPVEMTELINNEVRYRFSRVPGVAQVDLWGGYNREIRVEIDQDRLRAQGVPLNRVLTALRNANLDLPSGRITSGSYEISLRAPAQFENLDDIRDTMLETDRGAIVTLGQIATIHDTFTKPWRVDRVNGVRGIRVAVRKQPQANTVEVSRRVLEEIEAVNRDFPQIAVIPVINQGNFIERSIQNVARSVFYGGGLAIFVLLFFLRNIRVTAVIALSIPISIIATFAMLYFGGFTINLMTLGGLALGVGMMVDSSIVVLENIFRKRDEEHAQPALAAAEGAQEVASAIVASTITTLVIFLPVVFVQGVSGMLFSDLAFVIVFALVCSLLVSLSLVPMLSSRLMLAKGEMQKRRSPRVQRLVDWSDRMFRRMDTAYRGMLRTVLRHRWLTVGGAAAAFVLSLTLMPLLGTEFLPPSDEGEVRIHGEMEVGTRFEIVDAAMGRVAAVVEAHVPEKVASIMSVREGRGDLQLSLTPAAQRARSNREIADDLRERLEGTIAGMEIRTRAPQGQFLLERLLGGGGGEGFNLEVRGFELAVLQGLATRAMEAIEGIPGITDLDADFDEGVPQQEIRLDRAKVASLGLSPRDVTEVLRTAVAGSQAGNFQTRGHSYRILVQLADATSLSTEEVLDLTLATPSGELVSLRNLVEAVESRAPQAIQRKDQQRYVRVNVNVAGRDVGSVAAEVRATLDRLPRPDGYAYFLTGSFEEQEEAFVELMISVVFALLLVFMVLACQYESLLNPLVVMLSAPMAAIGVVLALLLTDTTFNLQSAIGCIMLGGIVVNNAILLVDQAGRLQRDGMPIDEAVAESGRRRLRPILMTTLTTVLGLLPLALGIGEGADAQAPLARAVVGGLTGSTLITLLLIPAVYSLLHSQMEKRRQKTRPSPSGAGAVEVVGGEAAGA
jgi:hydrophobic/amphiphilic exporter-1 (mainly G- bacteria), HAE1 family